MSLGCLLDGRCVFRRVYKTTTCLLGGAGLDLGGAHELKLLAPLSIPPGAPLREQRRSGSWLHGGLVTGAGGVRWRPVARLSNDLEKENWSEYYPIESLIRVGGMCTCLCWMIC